MRDQIEQFTQFIASIQGALGTAEEGSALIEVARNACRAEMELAAIQRKRDEESGTPYGVP